MGVTLDLLNNIRTNASAEYQKYVPVATQNNLYAVGNALSTYSLLWNEFCENLFNKIGKTIIEQKLFKNKLARFKSGEILNQQDVEEIFIGMIKAEGSYNPQGPNPLGRRNPAPAEVIYHRQNRQDYYVISIGDIDFVRVFRSESTLKTWISGQINAVYSSANRDEWLHMKNLLATYGGTFTYAKTTDTDVVNTKLYFVKDGENYVGVVEPKKEQIANYYEITTVTKTGYCDYEVPAITDSTAEKSSKAFVKTLRKAVQDVGFLSNGYNSAGVDTWTDAKDLVLLVNKDVLAEVDVEVLAKAFNLGKTDIQPEIVSMDDFGLLTDTYGLLVDKDFFRVWDTLSHMEPQRNAQGLFTNYFYHVHQILSLCTFKNAIRFKVKA